MKRCEEWLHLLGRVLKVHCLWLRGAVLPMCSEWVTLGKHNWLLALLSQTICLPSLRPACVSRLSPVNADEQVNLVLKCWLSCDGPCVYVKASWSRSGLSLLQLDCADSDV